MKGGGRTAEDTPRRTQCCAGIQKDSYEGRKNTEALPGQEGWEKCHRSCHTVGGLKTFTYRQFSNLLLEKTQNSLAYEKHTNLLYITAPEENITATMVLKKCLLLTIFQVKYTNSR